MKNKRLFEKIGDINEDFIYEASPENAKDMILPDVDLKSSRLGKFKIKKRRIGLAICASLLVAIGLWLFIPYGTTPPSVAKYKNSEYYSIIQKINEVNFKPPKMKNNFDRLMSLFAPKKGANSFPGVEQNGGAQPNQSYVETTDNQVDGIIEADIIKRSDKYIYYLNSSYLSLQIYSIEGENSSFVSSYKIKTDNSGYYSPNASWEMFLSSDCKRVTVITQYSILTSSSIHGMNRFDIISLNVEDVENITEIDRITVLGNYSTSRLVDGKLLILSTFDVYSGVDFSNAKNYLPQIIEDETHRLVKPEDITSPDILTSSRYTVVCKIDENTFDVEGFHTFLSYSDSVYVSHNFVYISRSFTDNSDTGNPNIKLITTKTEIIPLEYGGDKFKIEKSVTVDGYINNQYSMDEHEENLRVVTTTSERIQQSYGNTMGALAPTTNASLFVVDLSNMEVIAKVEKFAPERESVQSVRFDGNYAYVCTALIEILPTDPVFIIDLTDLENITVKDTGTISGYSTSLVNFGDGYLLGIGYDDIWGLKIEIYKESPIGVESICSYKASVSFSEDYKSYFIDRENKLIGLGMNDGQRLYRLFKFTGEDLEIIVEKEIKGDNSKKRAVFIDDYFYIVSETNFVVQKVLI